MPGPNALDVRSVAKVFFQAGGGAIPSALLVLDDVSLSVGDGEFVSVLGPSGCGKTTLGRIIAGIETYDNGEILIDGRPPGPPGSDRCIVFQNYGLLPWRTVVGNVELGLELQGVAAPARRETARQYIDLVGLKGFEGHYPHQISGGMQQRAGLARALSIKPRLLIMDEPFGALDAQMRTLLQDELLRICDLTKAAVLFVTHSIEEAVYLSDRIAIFSARPGRPVAEVSSTLPKPRYGFDARSSAEFAELRHQVTELLRERTDYYDAHRQAVEAH